MMKKYALFLFLCLLLLTACAPEASIPTEAPTQPETVAAEPEETLPPQTAAPTEALTLPPHSEL